MCERQKNELIFQIGLTIRKLDNKKSSNRRIFNGQEFEQA